MTSTVVSRSRGRVVVGPRADAWSLPAVHLLFVWALTLYDFQFFLSNVIAQPLVYIVYLGYPPLLLMMALRGPAILATSKSWVWYAPLLVLLIVSAITVTYATNRFLAKGAFQSFLIYYSIALATAVYIKSARQALPIIFLFFGQFAWYGIWSRTSGVVPWHPILLNYDNFGGLMVQGVGLCYWFAVGCQSKRLKYFLFALSAYCVLGVVASFARAAFLALVALVGWIWIRSPRKLAAAGGIALAALLVVAGASIIFEPGFFWNEIASVFEEGASEGTGRQRLDLWKTGFKVWLEHPIFGVGGANFGAFASQHFRFGELEAFPNPNVLYGFNLHNSFVQVLSEFGLVGIAAFGWALWDFQKRNREIRGAEAGQRWAERSGGKWNLRYLALGLEAANIANLLSAMFYSSLLMPGFYMTWVANRMLWSVTRSTAQPATDVKRVSRSGRIVGS